jgi:NADH-quinone oxidoreductase subunit E
MSVSADEITPKIREIVSDFPEGRESLIPILQRMQRDLGYLPPEGLEALAKLSSISPNEIYGVASFYAQFRFRRPGDHRITLCQGTACHVRGGQRLLQEFESRLGLEPGGTATPDGKFDLERVACLGCCALAPVVMVDDKVHGRLAITGVEPIVAEHAGADDSS